MNCIWKKLIIDFANHFTGGIFDIQREKETEIKPKRHKMDIFM